MIWQLNFRKIHVILILVSISLVGCASWKNKKEEASIPKGFKLIVEKTDDGIKMKSIEGSAWTDLSFSINDYQPQAVDEYGMTTLNQNSQQKDANLADFLFTITKTESGIQLKGIEGTAWIDLSFSLVSDQQQVIDQNGMTTLD